MADTVCPMMSDTGAGRAPLGGTDGAEPGLAPAGSVGKKSRPRNGGASGRVRTVQRRGVNRDQPEHHHGISDRSCTEGEYILLEEVGDVSSSRT